MTFGRVCGVVVISAPFRVVVVVAGSAGFIVPLSVARHGSASRTTRSVKPPRCGLLRRVLLLPFLGSAEVASLLSFVALALFWFVLTAPVGFAAAASAAAVAAALAAFLSGRVGVIVVVCCCWVEAGAAVLRV